jgi:hypothetical protein
MNLKIKSAQSFISANKGKVCVRVFIGVSAHMCMSICVCTVFLKKEIRFIEMVHINWFVKKIDNDVWIPVYKNYNSLFFC